MTDPWATFVPDFLSQGLASLIGAGIAAGVAIFVANRRIAAERKARQEDNALIRSEQLRSVRASAVHGVLEVVAPIVDAGRGILPSRAVDIALSSLLMDGTKDSYDVYSWVRWKFTQGHDPMTYDVVRAMLLEWMQPGGDAGVLASIRRENAEQPDS